GYEGQRGVRLGGASITEQVVAPVSSSGSGSAIEQLPDGHAATFTAVRRVAWSLCMAGSQRSLSARARRRRTCAPVCVFQREPARFMRIPTKVLHVASTLPLPIG